MPCLTLYFNLQTHYKSDEDIMENKRPMKRAQH